MPRVNKNAREASLSTNRCEHFGGALDLRGIRADQLSTEKYKHGGIRQIGTACQAPKEPWRSPQRRRPETKSSKVAVARTLPSLATMSNKFPSTASHRKITVAPSAPPYSM